ncbi:MAG: glycosyltransferase family 39 protein [Kiritimatiellae bacterium]|nr:glycosyltransferase family 39 protein [Kiritimatiellia bacterium]
MIFVIGAFFWILALAAVGRLLHASRTVIWAHAWLWGLLVLMAIVLLFRPHEDIFGGEDPGSYLNSGVTYGRQGTLFHVDPLLAQVPPETRSFFYYGHSGYGTTKDACLWVVNTNAAIQGPHFQPAYPLLISVATRLGKNSWSLYIVPLFALFTGLVLMVPASRLLAHRLAGLIAFGCYLLNPLTLWHARCARPEIIAGFMAFAGLALLLLAWQARSWKRWADILLGALCIGAAPFFHITAWYLVIPAAFAVGLLILRGRTDFLLYPLAALGMLLLFYGETRYVTDYYKVRRFFDVAFDYWPFLALCLALLAGASLAANRIRLRCSADHARNATGGNELPSVSGWLASGLALACVLFLVDVYFHHESIGTLTIFGSMVQDYNLLTDWRTFANMVSMPMALLMLIGWCAWLTGDRARRPERIVLALIVFPALTLAGTMRDFMMTRYLLLAVIPMAALSLAALATRLPEWHGRPLTAWLAPGLAAAICLAGLLNRAHLVTLVEHQGFLRFLAPFAQTIRQDHGIMLGEYSRITAPMEHMFGVPALGLDNERKNDYSAAELAWETIMRSAPQRPAFFMTPFQTPRSDRFDFTLVKQAVFQDQKLQQARNALPTRIRDNPLSLNLYQMTLKDSVRPAALLTNATALPIESGNMGWRRFANVRVDKPVLEGIALTEGEQVSLAIPEDLKSKLQGLLFVMYSSDPHLLAPLLNGAGPAPRGRKGLQFQALDDRWWLYACHTNITAASKILAIKARSQLFIAAALVQTPTNMVSVFSGFSKEMRKEVMPPLEGRWSRGDAAILVPASAPGYMLILAFTPGGNLKNIVSPAPKLLLLLDEAIMRVSMDYFYPDTWRWIILPLSPGRNRDAWIRFQVHQPWNPNKAGFPHDLGLFIGKLIVAPD